MKKILLTLALAITLNVASAETFNFTVSNMTIDAQINAFIALKKSQGYRLISYYYAVDKYTTLVVVNMTRRR